MDFPTREEIHDNLKKAVAINDVEQVQAILSREPYLVNRLVQANNTHYSFLLKAAENGFVELANLLIEAKANVNQQCFNGDTPLVVASRNGHAEIVQLLLVQPEIIVDLLDDCRATPLFYAAHSGHTSVIQHLLDAKASAGCVADDKNSVLMAAAQKRHSEACQLLLQHSADVNHQLSDGWSSLHWATKHGDEALTATLLQAKALVNVANIEGTTPLMLAAYHGHLTAAKLCLAAGADVQLCNTRLTAVLHCASANGTVAIVDELLRAGADVHARNITGGSPLIEASYYGNTACIPLLLKANADINAVDNRGYTPLMWAILQNRAETTELLLDNGADWLVKGNYSAKQLARAKVAAIRSRFECSSCGWDGMCCAACRDKYCVFECDKFSDLSNKWKPSSVDCRVHRKTAHQAVLEWTLAMSSLKLPPYVLEHIFNAAYCNYAQREGAYQERIGENQLSIAEIAHPPLRINENFVHLIIEERTHQANIKMFISVHQAYMKSESFESTTAFPKPGKK